MEILPRYVLSLSLYRAWLLALKPCRLVPINRQFMQPCMYRVIYILGGSS